MVDSVGKVVLPGDTIEQLRESEATQKVIVGPGLRRQADSVVVSKPGILRFREPNVYWVDSHQKRYVPVYGDYVIGVMMTKAGDVFRIDVGGSELASLSYLAFEGATKKNRTDVKVGDILYARFLVANRDMEPELTCIDGQGRSSGMGVIRGGGFMMQCSLNLVRKILTPDCNLLKTLGKNIQYEMAIGMNGRIWIKAKSTQETIAVTNAISAAEHMTNDQIRIMCKRLANALAGF